MGEKNGLEEDKGKKWDLSDRPRLRLTANHRVVSTGVLRPPLEITRKPPSFRVLRRVFRLLPIPVDRGTASMTLVLCTSVLVSILSLS